MRNGTGSKDDDMVVFEVRMHREARNRLHKLSKRNRRSSNAQLIHMIDQEEPPENET